MKFMHFSIKYFTENTLTSFKQFFLLQSHLLLCERGFCDISVTLLRQRHVIERHRQVITCDIKVDP